MSRQSSHTTHHHPPTYTHIYFTLLFLSSQLPFPKLRHLSQLPAVRSKIVRRMLSLYERMLSLRLYSVRFGVSLPQNVRETWVDICNDDSGNKCCADTGMSGHEYWIIRTQGIRYERSYDQQNCRIFQDLGRNRTSRAGWGTRMTPSN